MQLLPATAGILILTSLVLAWLLVLTRSLEVPMFRRFFRQDQDLLRAHIDYLLMALLLIAFHLMIPGLARWVQLAMCAGAALNPFIFLLVAVQPNLRKKKPLWFTALTTTGFLLTTAGFGAGAILLLRLGA